MEFQLTRKDLARKPYRGIYSEIARERGVTPQAIMMAVWVRKNTEIRDEVLRKIRERRRLEERRQQELDAFERLVSPN